MFLLLYFETHKNQRKLLESVNLNWPTYRKRSKDQRSHAREVRWAFFESDAFQEFFCLHLKSLVEEIHKAPLKTVPFRGNQVECVLYLT